MSEQQATVLYEAVDGVGRITLNRPDRLNALDPETIAQLERCALRAATDGEVRAVLITGQGRGFCSGGDVKTMATGAGAGDLAGLPPQAIALSAAGTLHHAIATLRRMHKPVICAVNGPAAGAGVGVALAGDIVWAARSASFKLAYTAIGLSPDGGTTSLVTRAIGPRLAAELFLTNRTVEADEAQRIGLCTRVLADEALMDATEQLASELASGPTRAFSAVKQLVRSAQHDSLESQMETERQLVAEMITSADFMEGVMAFMQKRQPKFKGK